MITRQEVTSKTGKKFFIYKENGSFVSKELYEKQEAMSNNKKKRVKKVVQPAIQAEALNTDFVETINKIENNLTQEWAGETGVFVDQIDENKPSVDFDKEYKKQVEVLEESFNIQGTNIPSAVIDTKTEVKKGFFVTLFEKWKNW